jgi:hypothetical protein
VTLLDGDGDERCGLGGNGWCDVGPSHSSRGVMLLDGGGDGRRDGIVVVVK